MDILKKTNHQRNKAQTGHSVFDASHAAIALIDRNGIIEECNPTMLERFHKKRAEIIGACLWELLPADVSMKFKTMVDEVFQTGISRQVEDYTSGSCNEVTIYPFFNSTGGVIHAGVSTLDISGRNKNEDEQEQSLQRGDALRINANLYQSLIETASEAIYLISEKGKVISSNKAASYMLGRPLEEIESLLITQIDQNYPVEDFLAFWRNIPYESPHIFETTHTRKDGSLVPVEVSGSKFKINDETYYFGIARDITERKRAEELLRESADRFNLAMQAANDGIFDWNLLTNDAYYSPGWKHMLGYKDDEIGNGFSVWEKLTKPEDVEKTWIILNECLSGKRNRFEIEFQMKHKHGHWIDIFSRAKVLFDENGKAIRIVGTHIDITDRKQNELFLRESEERFRIVLEGLPGGVFAHDMEGKIRLVNKMACSNTGYTREELLTMSISNIDPDSVTRDDRAILWNNMQVGETIVLESTHIRKNGSRYPVEFHLTAVSLNSQQIILAVAYDISERKRAENALRENEVKMKSIFLAAPVGIGLVTNRIIQDVNEVFCKMLGYDRNELIGQSSRILYPSDEVYEFVGQEKYRQIHERGTGTVETTMKCKNGAIIDVLLSSTPLNVSDLTEGVTFTALDITDWKRTENALRESEEKAQGIISSITDPMIMMNQDLAITWANEHALHMFGDLIGINCFDAFHSDQNGLHNKVLNLNSLNCGNARDYESEVRDVHGELRQFWCSTGIAAVDNAGLPVMIVLTMRDITERKQSERALLRQQKIITLNNRIANVFLTAPSGNIYVGVLEVILGALDSRFGYFGYIDDPGNLVCSTMALNISDQPKIAEKVITFPSSSWRGLWGQSLQNKKTVILNEGLTLPEGHVPLKNAMAVAIVHHDELIGQFVVADKSDGYNQYDRELLENVASQTAPVLYAILENIRQKKEHEKLEEQFRQSQKMEAVGRLAGGVAHDFNNMLNVILGNAELVMNDIDESSKIHEELTEIHKAAERSANLTRQLLAFARKQTITPRMLDLNETIEGMLKMLHRLIGEDIELEWSPGKDVWPVVMDTSQLDQVLANLCVNARDAIADIGKIIIETDNKVIDTSYCDDHPESSPGEYVLLAVSDNGNGMDDETLTKAFEPFFTTKELSEGTGLGLSTVYGIVKQNNGFVNVYSEPGIGTTFKIYFPRLIGKEQRNTSAGVESGTERGHETILLVEDEKALLALGIKTLEQYGYVVLAAESPVEAIHIASEHRGIIHILITDVVMPEMNGRDLAKRILSMYPDIKCLFISGYTANMIAHHGILDENVNFIQKPFSMKNMAVKVRSIIDNP